MNYKCYIECSEVELFLLSIYVCNKVLIKADVTH